MFFFSSGSGQTVAAELAGKEEQFFKVLLVIGVLVGISYMWKFLRGGRW